MKLRPLTHSLRLTLFATFAFSALALAENKLPEITVDAAPMARTHENSFAPIVEKVSPSVVTISISKNVRIGGRNQGGGNPLMDDPFFRKFFGIPDDEPSSPRGNGKDSGAGRKRVMPVGLGSGVIVSKDGYIITNNHVVDQADEITVTLADGKTELKATKIGSDAGSDIAVIKVDAKDLKPITFTDSDKIKVGDIALAIGNPFALRQTVTKGIISAVGRNQTGISEFGNFIQTDASINPGNSGGALVDVEGRLIGINTAIFSMTGGNQGIGFAVPANLARSVMESLIKTGRVSRGFLGIVLQPLNEELAKQFKLPNTDGALIAEVAGQSPAEKAGLKSGDVVTEVSGKKVEGTRELQLLIANLAPGSKADLKVMRDGKDQTFTVELAERPTGKGLAAAEPAKADDPDVLDGVTVADIDAESRKRFELPESAKGVVVTEIDADSPSAEAGIKVGDVIYEANRDPITNSQQAVELSEKLKKEKKVLLRVSTKGQSRFVVVERKD